MVLLKFIFLLYMLRGTIVFELFQLIGYWVKTLSRNQENMVVERISFGKHTKQYLMLFSPQNLDSNKPTILYYHGGGWIFGKPELFSKKAALFTKLGYQVIMPCYRKLPRYTSNEILEDVELTLNHLHKLKAAGKVLNLDQILLGGVSAGANLVSLIYFNKAIHEKAGYSQDQFIGMFLYAPPIDLSKMKRTPVLYRYAGASKSDRFKNASPIQFIENSKPIPILCVHGNKDAMVQIGASLSFRDAYDKLHRGYLNYNVVDQATHLDAASWAHSNNAMRKQLLDWLNQFS